MSKDTDYLGNDKLKHFIVCFAVSIVCPVIALVLAIGKEVIDLHTSGNHFCVWDLCADILGMLCGTPFFCLWLNALIN